MKISKSFKIYIHIILVFLISKNVLAAEDFSKNIVIHEKPLIIKELKFKDFNLQDIDLTNKKGNIMIINFWASWCGPCRIEHPVLMKLSAENNLNILGVNFKDKKELARKFLKDLGNPYNSLLKDVEGKQSVIFGIYGIPESLIINNKNTIIKKFVGPLSLDDYKEIKEIIK